MFADLIRIRLNDLLGRYRNQTASYLSESNQPPEPATKRVVGRVD
jgi:hypothetical protein